MKIKLFENGTVPKFMHPGDACADCYSAEEKTIYCGKRALVKLGFALEIPEGYEVVIRPRSGMSKNSFDVCIGTVDSNYRGEIMACVINNSDKPLEINPGDRICQMKYQKAEQCSFEVVDELDETERGANGFGSSGMRG